MASILAIDSSGNQSTVGVWTDSGGSAQGTTAVSRRHGCDLVPLIRDLLQKADARVGDVTTIAVGLGPGSYTGMRIALTAGRMLAYAAGARLIGFDSLEGIAQNAPDGALKVHVVADAQRGDVYCSTFERDGVGGPLRVVAPTAIEPIGRWAESLQPGALILGPGLGSEPIRRALGTEMLVAEPEWNRPAGGRLVELARRIAASGAVFDLWNLEPNYLRRSAAEDQWRSRMDQN